MELAQIFEDEELDMEDIVNLNNDELKDIGIDKGSLQKSDKSNFWRLRN